MDLGKEIVFLFTLVLDRGRVKGLIAGDGSVEVSHLLFADVTVLFSPNDKANLINTLTLLQFFESISGLCIILS